MYSQTRGYVLKGRCLSDRSYPEVLIYSLTEYALGRDLDIRAPLEGEAWVKGLVILRVRRLMVGLMAPKPQG